MEYLSLFLARAMLALVGLLALITPAAADEPLSLSAAINAALARSRSLEASAAAAQGAREMAVAAAQRPDPVLRLSLDNLPVDGPERFSVTRDFMTMRSVSITQTLPNSSKRQARRERFEREADAALSERDRRIALLRVEVAQAWLERHMQEQRIGLLQAQVAEARLLVQTTESAVRGGKATLNDAVGARELLAQLEQSVIGATADRAEARLWLARLIGGASDQPLADPPPLRQRPAALSEPTLAERLPDIAALQSRERAARAEAELARQELDPDWSVEFMFSQRGRQFSNMASVAVSVPLQWDRPQRQERELAVRLSRVDELQAEREEQTRERLLQVQRWQEQWRSGLDRLDFLDTRRVPLSAQRVDAALAAYRGGREGLGPVLQARRAVLDLALERLLLERQTAGAWAQLEYLLTDNHTGVKP
jgi:outer membrane protein, heavy metal efflux system